MHPIVALRMAELEIEDRHRRADAERLARRLRLPWRVRLGAGLRRLGTRIEGASDAQGADAPLAEVALRVP